MLHMLLLISYCNVYLFTGEVMSTVTPICLTHGQTARSDASCQQLDLSQL